MGLAAFLLSLWIALRYKRQESKNDWKEWLNVEKARNHMIWLKVVRETKKAFWKFGGDTDESQAVEKNSNYSWLHEESK